MFLFNYLFNIAKITQFCVVLYHWLHHSVKYTHIGFSVMILKASKPSRLKFKFKVSMMHTSTIVYLFQTWNRVINYNWKYPLYGICPLAVRDGSLLLCCFLIHYLKALPAICWEAEKKHEHGEAIHYQNWFIYIPKGILWLAPLHIDLRVWDIGYINIEQNIDAFITAQLSIGVAIEGWWKAEPQRHWGS